MQNSTTAYHAQFSFSHQNILSAATNETAALTKLFELISKPTKQQRTKFVQVQNTTRTLYEGHLSERDAENTKSKLDHLKKNLGFYVPNGVIERGHKSDDLTFNGCIGFDFDFHHRGGDLIAKGLKEALKRFDFVSLVHISAGGYGVKGIFKTDLTTCDKDLYSFAEKQIFAYLGTEGVSFKYDKHGYGKTCYFAYDATAYLNTSAKPFSIDLDAYEKEKAVKQRQNVRKTAVTNENEVKQAVNFLIENKVCVASCYDDYLSFTAACLNTCGTDGGDIAYQIVEN